MTLAAPPTATFLHDPDFIAVLYIVAFSLFISGLSGLTGPRTAVRGNQIAAVGMGVAVVATLPHRRDGELGPHRARHRPGHASSASPRRAT